MTITNHPLHRSGRALLAHPAPALGDDAKSPEWIRVMQLGRWQPTVGQTDHLRPRQPPRLAATPQRPVPVTGDMKAKRRQRGYVRRHSVVPVVSSNHRPQPLTGFGYSMMHSFAKFRFDFLQLGSFPLAHRPPPHREHPMASRLTTNVREAKKVECLRFPLSPPLSIFSRIATELDDARFRGMQFQFEPGEAFRQLLVEPLGFRWVLKAHHEVISPADDRQVAFGFCLTPVLHPEVEHIVQIEVCQQRRSTAALGRPFFTAPPLSFFQHPRVQPFTDEPHDALVSYAVLEELNQPFMVQTIEERTDVTIQHPVHLSRQQTGVQSIQRIVLAFAGPVAIREAEKVSLVNGIHHRDRRPLGYLVFQRRDAKRSLPTIVFSDVASEHWLRSISPAPQPRGEVCEIALQILTVLSPRFPINARSRITLQPIISLPQSAQVVDVVHEAGELHLPIFHGCLPYPPQRTLHDFPVQCPVRVLPRRLPFGQTPSLHLLRHWFVGNKCQLASFVRGLRRYYGSVRLPTSVHHRRTSLDFSMRSIPSGSGVDERRISRFSRRLLPCMPGVSDLAGYQHSSPKWSADCGLPLSPIGSASRFNSISWLNTQPALSPVNASPPLLRAPPHDSGPSRLARPLTFETFIQYNLPVYPGARERELPEILGATEIPCNPDI